jgi:hypothetical protein
MGDIVKFIIDLVTTAIEQGVRSGKTLREALAVSLETAAAEIRSGRLNVDQALERAKDDQTRIDALRNRGGG